MCLTRTVRGTHNVVIMGLKQYRLGKNLTATQMADLCGVAHTTILRWEDGSMLPRGDAVKTIVRVTGGKVTANDLFGVEAV